MWAKKKPSLDPQERMRVHAFARLANTEDGRVLLAWLREFQTVDFLAYRGAGDNAQRKALVDGAVDRTAAILLEIEGASTKLTNSSKESA